MLIFFPLLSLLSFFISTYTMLDHFVLSLKSLRLHLFLFPTFFSSCLAIWKISIEPSSGSLMLFSIVSNLLLSLSRDLYFIFCIFQFNIHWLFFYFLYLLTKIPISYITFIHALFHILKDIYNRCFKILMC